ncbi:unnamed protein product [Urochloa humidicola]
MLVLVTAADSTFLPPFSGRQGCCEDNDDEEAEEKPMSESSKQAEDDRVLTATTSTTETVALSSDSASRLTWMTPTICSLKFPQGYWKSKTEIDLQFSNGKKGFFMEAIICCS